MCKRVIAGHLQDTPKYYLEMVLSRDDERRGEGVAHIYKESVYIKSKETVNFLQFECIMCCPIVKNMPTFICVVDRLPSSPTNTLNTNIFMTQ